MKKKTAAISLDLDNLWSYQKIHGDEGWDKYPSYLQIFIPYVLDVLDELDVRITFFIVGIDAEKPENQTYLRMIVDRGHHIANHSHNHDSWLQSYSKEQIDEEIARSEAAIERVTGQKPVGFRGPGFSWSPDLLDVLKARGYTYDTSTLPTYIGPLARLYYFRQSGLSQKERKERGELFGTFADGLRKLKPYRWENNLLEIPVTTIPVFKIPFHLSYLLYIYGISPFLMKVYLEFALFMCSITGTTINYLLHPLDLIGNDHIKELSFFPGMKMSSAEKIMAFRMIISRLKRKYDIKSLNDYAHETLYKCSDTGL